MPSWSRLRACWPQAGSTLGVVSKLETTLRIDEALWDDAAAEAARRGLADPSEVVEEALRRYVAGEDLGRLMKEFRDRDSGDPHALDDDQAAEIAAAELTALRSERSA